MGDSPALAKSKPVRPPSPSALRRRFDTLEKFRRWRPEDGFKYEWNNGIVEKSPKMITFENLYIVERLDDLFQSVKSSLPLRGKLFTEPESMTSPTQLRIPDMAYYTSAQIREGREGKLLGIPAFAIEFVSETDSHKRDLTKLEEYFGAGMKILWLIFPELQLVYVYTSPIDVTICRDERVCSAEPVLPGFKIAARDLFA